ncbi:FecR family protein [uncultured Chitinophaga sp.]|uniref:FecR family protein n=1 Tax=uncultured Chitinophaga sp. TaxID=339340 RepID=UPI002609D22C|nr:FecR domain-containing protein [uncultured Chitinophaga sp.]
MDHSYFLEILQKYREGNASPEEERFLLASYDAFESQPDVTPLLTPEEREKLAGRMHQHILQQIAAQQAPARRAPVRMRWIAAAAVVILAGAAMAAFLLIRPASDAPGLAAADQSVQPKAENNLISLPDGSTVLVSTGSKLRYPGSFANKNKREVYLEGKALFTVEQQTGQPFVVHAGGLQTTVLGTTFEVAAAGEGDVTVTVFKGRVRVEDEKKSLGELTAHQQIVYSAGESRQQTSRQAPEWQQQDLLFDDVTLLQAARLLEDRFGYSIAIPDEALREQRFSTTFGSGESLEQALKSICAFNQASYTLDSSKKTVIIYRP